MYTGEKKIYVTGITEWNEKIGRKNELKCSRGYALCRSRFYRRGRVVVCMYTYFPPRGFFAKGKNSNGSGEYNALLNVFLRKTKCRANTK